jgi:uncharacterized protein YndB with AHSA1/START domain
MAAVKVHIDIDAPPERVWAALEDISTHVRWMADAETITFSSPQTSGVGTTFDCLTRIGPISLVDRMEVTEWTAGRRMGVRHVGVVTGTGAFTLSGRRRGRVTRFSWRERLEFPWWMGGPVGAFAAKPVLGAVWRRNLRRLRDLVESGELP